MNTNQASNIVLVDDHILFRDGLKFILSNMEGINISGEASNGIEFLEILHDHVPDLVLMDISMPEMDGFECTQVALSQVPDLKVIALSSFGEEIYYRKMIEAGVKGFLTKNSSKDELEQAINSVLNGDHYFSQELLRKFVLHISGKKSESKQNSMSLTDRELDILKYICKGFSNKEIAEELFISPKTVDNHRTSLLAKTQAKNTAHLVMIAIKEELVNL